LEGEGRCLPGSFIVKHGIENDKKFAFVTILYRTQ
jgi:hypothetical protein